MPEISEVRLTAQFVTETNKKRIIQDVSYLKTNKLKLIEDIEVKGKKISAVSRGKELKLFFDNEPVVISLGMTGCFKNFKKRGYKNKHWKHGHIRFRMSDKSWFCWSDVRRFGKSISTKWNPNRGPDVFDEEKAFREHIMDNLNHQDFLKPAHTAIMNQKWFNGMGNYLRAEILGKWNKNPFQPIKNPTKKCLDFTATWHILHLCGCTLYDGFPNSWEWWAVAIANLIVMSLLGEYLCMRREMRDIPLFRK